MGVSQKDDKGSESDMMPKRVCICVCMLTSASLSQCDKDEAITLTKQFDDNEIYKIKRQNEKLQLMKRVCDFIDNEKNTKDYLQRLNCKLKLYELCSNPPVF